MLSFTNRGFPVLYEKKEECCGCTACLALCPQDAIHMAENEEGFLYPLLDKDRCTGCFLCMHVCPFSLIKKQRNKSL